LEEKSHFFATFRRKCVKGDSVPGGKEGWKANALSNGGGRKFEWLSRNWNRR